MLSLIQAVCGRPWMIQAEIAAQIRSLIAREGIGALRNLAEIKAAIHAHDARAAGRGNTRATSTVAVISIVGTLTQRGDIVGSAETRSADAVAFEVAQAAKDPSVDAIVLDVDSPGGEVYGIPEAWQAIKDAERSTPIVACANSMCASAALYLASAATERMVTQGGEIGSLGVYAMHVDESAAMEAEGVKVEFIVASESPFKAEGNPAQPLSEDARGQLQASVDRYMGYFVRDVARGCGVSVDVVRRDFGKGRMLSPERAVEVGMADRIGTLTDAIRRAAQLGKERRQAGKTAAASAEARATAAANLR